MKLAIFVGIIFVTALTALTATAQNEESPFPKLKDVPPISIPDEVMNTGLGGDVRVYVKVDKEGGVARVEGAYGPGSVCRAVTRPDVIALRNSAMTAAKGAKFERPTKNQSFGWVTFELPKGQDEQNEAKLERFILSPATTGLRDKILELPKPPYPPAARAVRAAGPVTVKLIVDENGDVFSSTALSGHPLLRFAATNAACSAKFKPHVVTGSPAGVVWVITYNFTP